MQPISAFMCTVCIVGSIILAVDSDISTLFIVSMLPFAVFIFMGASGKFDPPPLNKKNRKEYKHDK